MAELAALQARMAEALRSGRYASLAGAVRPGRIPAEEALAVHRNTALHGLINALRLSHPTVDALVGEDFFDQAARAFIEAQPPSSAWLTGYGEGFADFLQSYGQVCAGLTRQQDIDRMGRLFWFTVEFGVIRQDGRIKLYGSGLISSHGESNYVLSGGPEIRDFNLDEVLDREFNIHEMQKVLYAVESFDQIYEATRQARSRLG